jgi:cell division protein FtsB
MKVDLGIWDRLTRLILFLIVIAGLAAVGVWYLPLIRHNERMRKEILQLDSTIEKEDQRARELKAQIDAHRDPRTIERLARERLNFARTNETVIRYQAPAATTTNPPASAPTK